MNFKLFISIVAVILTFVGYFPYFRDIFNGKTKPHLFSWVIWTITVGITYALQVSAGAGSGAWVTGVLTIIMGSISILSFKYGTKNITKLDIVCLIIALSALPLWFFAHQPVLSAVILAAIDMVGFFPTIRKSWNDPYSETLSFYFITTVRHSLSVLALQNYNIITIAFPGAWVIANAVFAVILVVRRKSVMA